MDRKTVLIFRILEWFELEEKSKSIYFQLPLLGVLIIDPNNLTSGKILT